MFLLQFDSVIRSFVSNRALRVFFMFWVSIACSFAVSSHSQGFHGRIMANDSVCVPYATVYLPALKTGVITDPDGYYRIESLPAGTYRVEFSSIGYQTVSDTLVLAAGDDLEYPVLLPEVAYTLKEVCVMSDGGNYALELLSKVQENAPAYYGAVTSYEADIVDRYDQNLKDLPAAIRRVIKTLAFLTPARKIVNLIFKYPELAFQTGRTVSYDGKKAVESNGRLIECNENLTDKEKKIIIPEGGKTSSFIAGLSSDDSPWGKKGMTKFDFEWNGSYEEGGRVIDVIEFSPKKNKEYWNKGSIYIVEDLWCILRVEYSSFVGGGRYECREVSPDCYLPVSLLMDISCTAPMDSVNTKNLSLKILTGSSISYKDISVKK